MASEFQKQQQKEAQDALQQQVREYKKAIEMYKKEIEKQKLEYAK